VNDGKVKKNQFIPQHIIILQNSLPPISASVRAIVNKTVRCLKMQLCSNRICKRNMEIM